MAFFSKEQSSRNIDGDIITAAVIYWDDGTNLNITSNTKPLPVNVVAGGGTITGSAVLNGKVTVTTAGTAVALSGSSTSIKAVIVKALYSNTGKIYVGNSSVDSSNGYELESGEGVSLGIDDLNKVYIDADNNGEGVVYIAIQ